MFWPVIDPLGRHHNAKRLSESANPPPWPPRTMKLSMAYWTNEENMAEASPLLADQARREGGDAAGDLDPGQERPDPRLYAIRTPASTAPRRSASSSLYRKAGGKIDLEYYDAPLHFTSDHPELPESIAAMKRAVAFTHEHIRT